MPNIVQTILRAHALRDTQPRRLVIEALCNIKKPASHKEIYSWIEKQGAATNLVTVYRILETFEGLGIVHRHPSSGGFILCSMEEEGCHGTVVRDTTCHGFLSCQECGTVQEFTDEKLCKEEKRIARKAGFTPKHHMSEIIGVCTKCQ